MVFISDVSSEHAASSWTGKRFDPFNAFFYIENGRKLCFVMRCATCSELPSNIITRTNRQTDRQRDNCNLSVRTCLSYMERG